MYEKKPHTLPADALRVAVRLLSHPDSLRRTGKGARKRMRPIKDSLESNLESLAESLDDLDHLDASKLPDLQLARFRCDDLFAQFSRAVSWSWGESYPRLAATDLRKHPLYLHVIQHGGKEAASLFPSAETDEQKTDAEVLRFLLARMLFIFAAESTGLTARPGREHIVRAIKFPPEYKQAGISILNYFSEIVDRRYPDLNVGVRIEQSGSTITLIIETPTGETERIEQELGEFGLAVTGQTKLEDYARDSSELLLLRTKLEIASLEVRQVREILSLERTHHGARIERLENELSFMRSAFDRTQSGTTDLVDALRALALSTSRSASAALVRIIDVLQSDSAPDQRALVDDLKLVRAENPGILDTLTELFVKGSIQGAAGNYLYAALQALQKLV